jgi:hypothetical protein
MNGGGIAVDITTERKKQICENSKANPKNKKKKLVQMMIQLYAISSTAHNLPPEIILVNGTLSVLLMLSTGIDCVDVGDVGI